MRLYRMLSVLVLFPDIGATRFRRGLLNDFPGRVVTKDCAPVQIFPSVPLEDRRSPQNLLPATAASLLTRWRRKPRKAHSLPSSLQLGPRLASGFASPCRVDSASFPKAVPWSRSPAKPFRAASCCAPLPLLNEIFLGTLARAHRLADGAVGVCAFACLSTHYHLVLQTADAEGLSRFMLKLTEASTRP